MTASLEAIPNSQGPAKSFYTHREANTGTSFFLTASPPSATHTEICPLQVVGGGEGCPIKPPPAS